MNNGYVDMNAFSFPGAPNCLDVLERGLCEVFAGLKLISVCDISM